MSAQCGSCHAPVVWAITEKGKRMPVDAEPVEEWPREQGEGSDG